MGKKLNFKNIKLNSILVLTFILIILCSFIASICTVGFMYDYVFSAYSYESKFDEIDSYIKIKGAALLTANHKKELETIFEPLNIQYQVMDDEFSIVYGNIPSETKNDITNVNCKVIKSRDEKITRMYLISDSNMRGYVLVYAPEMAVEVQLLILISTIVITLLFIVLFAVIFSKLLRRRIERPLIQLMNAAEKVKKHELDFILEYEVDDEIGALFSSFREMQEELKNTLRREWENKQKEKDMIGAITHDLNTPLTVIQCSSEILLNGMMDNREKLIKHLRSIDKNANRATNLLEEIKEIFILEKNSSEPKLEKINIGAFINEKIEDYRIMVEEASINFESSISDSDDLDKVLSIAPDKLTRVLDNLISNSIRFTDIGGTISLDIEIKENSIRFLVCDTGKGFRSKDLPYLFNKFYKSDESRSLDKSHFGLGLYICKMIIEEHGGTITARNNSPIGACVLFDIPISYTESYSIGV